MPNLPAELLNLVIEALAIPSHLSSYRTEHLTLTNLCITNKAIRYFATPHLYSSIILSTAHQLHALIHSLNQPDGKGSKTVHSLSLRDFDEALNEENADAMIELLVLMQDQPGFCRLIIDRDLRRWAYNSSDDENAPDEPEGDVGVVSRQCMSLRAALEALSNIRELHSMQDEVYIAPNDPTPHIGWTPHHNLQRLTLYNPILDADLTKAFSKHPNLQQVILVRPDFDEDFLGEALKHIQTWREIVIVGHEKLSMNRCAVAIRDAAASLDHCCKLIYVRYQWPGSITDWEGRIIWDIQLFVRCQLEGGGLFQGETLNSEKTKGDAE